MKEYTSSEPAFQPGIKIVETTDPAHADNINEAPQQLLQNTLVLYGYLEMLCDESAVEEAFYAVFAMLPGQETDETAMSADEVEEALATEWNGES